MNYVSIILLIVCIGGTAFFLSFCSHYAKTRGSHLAVREPVSSSKVWHTNEGSAIRHFTMR